MEFEAKLIMFLQAGANEGFTAFFNAISLLGSWVGIILAFVCLFFISKKYAFTLLVSYGFGVGLNYILKLIINRDRPYLTYDNITAFSEALGNSFPSGHAVSSVIMAIFICFIVWKLAKTKFTKIATIFSMTIFVGLVCLSRMYLGLHYFSDLIAGLAVGGIVALIGLRLFNKSFKPKRKINE